MKVLLETYNNRKGYKFFENKDEIDAYLKVRLSNG